MFESVRHVVSPKFRRAERVLAKRYLGPRLKVGARMKSRFVKWSGPGYSTEYFDPRIKEVKKYGIVVEGGPMALILTIGRDSGGRPYQQKFPTQDSATKFVPFRAVDPVGEKLKQLLNKK